MPTNQKLALMGLLQAVMNVSHGPAHLKTRAGYLYSRLMGRKHPFAMV